jgi:hypothetical protein
MLADLDLQGVISVDPDQMEQIFWLTWIYEVTSVDPDQM